MECRFHPGREAPYRCDKMGYAYCQECLNECRACTDPCNYCKTRAQCVIWERCGKEAKKRCQEERPKASGGSEL
jgi:hypothetical protein